jgi:hypothetical protein
MWHVTPLLAEHVDRSWMDQVETGQTVDALVALVIRYETFACVSAHETPSAERTQRVPNV